MCLARPEAASRAKPGPNRPSQAKPCRRLFGGFGPAWGSEKPKAAAQAVAFQGHGYGGFRAELEPSNPQSTHIEPPSRHRPDSQPSHSPSTGCSRRLLVSPHTHPSFYSTLLTPMNSSPHPTTRHVPLVQVGKVRELVSQRLDSESISAREKIF